MTFTPRLPSLFIALAATTLAATSPARAQDVPPAAPAQTPPPAADPNGPPPGTPPAEYGPPPTYGAPASPAYPPPPPPAYPPPGYAPQPGYPPPGYGAPAYNAGPPVNIHDGFFLHLHLGGGFTSISGSDGLGNKLKISGGSVSFGVAVGGAVAENLILFGNLFGSVAGSPTVSDGSSSGSTSDSAALAGLGLGLTYYFMPANVYVSGTIAGMSFSMADSNGNTLYSSNTGVGFQGMVGKEWWVSSDWGLGVAGEFMVASMKDKNDSSISWTGSAFSLLFSSTFN